MRKRILYTLIAIAGGLLTACTGPKTIPESTMREIMRDAFISEGIIRHNLTSDPELRTHTDSLDIHTPILRRYGYTLEDFRHTIAQMASRKSNPLDNILAGVAADIKAASGVAGERFNRFRKVDSLAVSLTADTVWRSDTVLRGKLDGFRFSYSEVHNFDSLVPVANYRLHFLYSTGDHARAYTKSVRYKRISQSQRASENTIWIPVARDTTLFTGELQVNSNVRRLDFLLQDTHRAGAQPDTSYLTRLRLVRLLPSEEARQKLYRQMTGFYPTLQELYYERYIEDLQKAGLTPSPDAGR